MKEIVVFTFFGVIILGFLAGGILGNYFNWPNADVVVAVSTIGAVLVHQMERLIDK